MLLRGLVSACPLYTEFFPDPVDVGDQEGEFVEIFMGEGDGLATPESLSVQFEDRAALRLAYPRTRWLLLVHDTARCVASDSVSCAALPFSLPNSRGTVWRLWAGECRDSVNLPRPKPGKSLVRLGEADEWELAEPTMGAPQGREDALLPDSSRFDKPPLRISEVHHCPAEPEPEWVEVYNAGDRAYPLSEFRFCGRGGSWAQKAGSGNASGRDSIGPYESVVFTRDTLQLREFVGFGDVRLLQVSMGYLNNTSGSIAICMGEYVVDSVAWDKSTAACPAGFSPLTGRAENTPGFQGRTGGAARGPGGAGADRAEPFTFKISSRVLRRGGAPLRVLVESESVVTLRLLDSAGREVFRQAVPARSDAWWNVPLDGVRSIGVAYVSMAVGKYEKLVGILLRP